MRSPHSKKIMIKTLRQAVFLRLSLFLMTGVIIQTQADFFPYWIYIAVFSLLILSFSQIPKINTSYRWRWLFGLGLMLLCLSSAGVLTHVTWKQSEWTEESGFKNYLVQIIDEPVRKPQTWMLKVKTGNKKTVIYLPVDSVSSALSPSDWIIIKTSFEKTNEFNLRKQGIAARSFVSKSNWRKIESSSEQHLNLRFLSLKCRRILLNQLKEILPDEKSFSVAAAILFGYSSEIDKETRQVFAATGTAHILAVSGMHFAIIYSILCFPFSFLGNTRQGRIIRQLTVLPLLWIFAFITGMPPSVIRAAVMITVWGIGNAFFFRALTINTLGAAAFFMLLYNPLNLFNIGFQLSFSAVLAILLINPYLTSLYRSRNPIFNYVWELSCTSTTAQLGTAPFGLYYFHQFPVLYLISNIFVIPLVGVLLVLIPSSLLLRLIFGNLQELMFPLRKILLIMFNVLGSLSEIPNGVIDNIQLSVKDALNIELGLIFSFLLLIKKRVIYLCLLIIVLALQVFYYLCT